MDQYPTEVLVVPTPAVAILSDNADVADALADLLRGRNAGWWCLRRLD